MPLPTDPIEHALAASYGSYKSWAGTADRAARTRPAREGLEQKWLTMADGDPTRAQHYRMAHYRRMQLESLRSRRARAAGDKPDPISNN